MPFRQAHEVAGRLVGEAVRRGVSLAEVAAEDPLTAGFGELFVPGATLVRRRSPGASGPDAARVQYERLTERLGALVARLA